MLPIRKPTKQELLNLETELRMLCAKDLLSTPSTVRYAREKGDRQEEERRWREYAAVIYYMRQMGTSPI